MRNCNRCVRVDGNMRKCILVTTVAQELKKKFNYPSLKCGKQSTTTTEVLLPKLSIKLREFRRREIQQVEKDNDKNNILVKRRRTIKTTVTTLNDNSRIKKKSEEGKHIVRNQQEADSADVESIKEIFDQLTLDSVLESIAKRSKLSNPLIGITHGSLQVDNPLIRYKTNVPRPQQTSYALSIKSPNDDKDSKVLVRPLPAANMDFDVKVTGNSDEESSEGNSISDDLQGINGNEVFNEFGGQTIPISR
uniref:Bm8600, isoform e n=1 Tax=Brugia malayi TaxID=6279 RepID=A0A1I9G5W2_BRUMA|nr:Bm8600, isoform e [Brugia malayi]